jgi:hypothetical protein
MPIFIEDQEFSKAKCLGIFAIGTTVYRTTPLSPKTSPKPKFRPNAGPKAYHCIQVLYTRLLRIFHRFCRKDSSKDIYRYLYTVARLCRVQQTFENSAPWNKSSRTTPGECGGEVPEVSVGEKCLTPHQDHIRNTLGTHAAWGRNALRHIRNTLGTH